MDIRIGMGFSLTISHKRIETGAISSRVVTLSKIADKNAVNKHKQ